MWPNDCLLDDQTVPFINADLSTGSEHRLGPRLKENPNLCFMGTTKVGPFEIDADTARKMLAAPLNPTGVRILSSSSWVNAWT